MKVFASATAVVLAASASTSSAINCFLNVDAITEALLPIIQPAYDCQAATGFAIVPPASYPTPEQLTAVCAKCPELVTKGKDVKFPDCTVTIKGEEVAIEKLFGTILGQCGSAKETAASNSTSAANTTTTVPAANTTTTPMTTPTPVKETAGSSSGSSAADKSSATVEEPSATTKAPAATTAAPKSAGVSVTLGAAVAVACSAAALVL